MQSDVKFWFNGIKFGAVTYLLSCMRLHKYINLTVQNIILLRLDAVEVGLILKHDKFTI